MSRISRRRFLRVAGAGVAASTLPQVSQAAVAASQTPLQANAANPCIAISSANGIESVAVARGLVLKKGMRPVSAAVRGVASVEADPNDMSVGYGGLPNELGKVQLDSACMDGPTHNAGSVASIEDIKHPAQVAELVMDRTDHINLVGPGARQFALDYGFQAEDLLTERARQIWLKWRAKRSGDDRLWPLLDTEPADSALADEPRPWGTIHCSVLAPNADVGCCTTTSGLAFKIPGRIGDSPLIGCGLYCDNEVGSAGATGRGEAAILSGGSWLVVERMRAGDTPEEACLYALRRVAENAERGARWQPALWKDGQPNFGLTFYAVRKDGLYGSASMRGTGRFAVADAKGARLENCAIAFGNN
ncbi:MAG: N(4)-(beta-N-acetylglucosaminyl)-L-asparaginase [Planctomycetota bacterium]|jgi:N4-(beta-N-acetylglucosaminyl)-L-asparaginase|nr:N(4)-(beta-N-acetylglucosaminyl)-L-asparaginase [Planctomycetota bacterium]